MFALLAVPVLVIMGCVSNVEFKKHIPNKNAVLLYKEAMNIAISEDEYNEKMDSAIFLLERAIKIDSLYIEPHIGIIGFSALNKEKTNAIKYCHRAQTIFKDFPEFIMIEGVIRESNNEIDIAKKLYKEALAIYEKNLIEEMEENPDLKLNYISCLYLNNQKEKAKSKLWELTEENGEDSFYSGLTLEELMEGYHEIKNR